MNWSHSSPVAVVSGEDALHTLAKETAENRVLLLTSRGMVARGQTRTITNLFPDASWTVETVAPNPDLDALDARARALRASRFSMLVAFGGGSVMDAGKVLAAALPSRLKAPLAAWLRNNPGPPRIAKVLPLVCIPTTAGTGAEVTPFATVWDTAHATKRSLAHPLLYPKKAVLVPSATLTLPELETLSGAMDALSHALETLWNRHATPVSLACAREALRLIPPVFPRLEKEPGNSAHRAAMQNAAFLAGLAISQSRTAIAHSLSYSLTLRYGVPHGLACSFCLPAIGAFVRKKNLWHAAGDAALWQRASRLVRECGVAGRVAGYCSPDAVVAMAGTMLASDRAGNFVAGVTAGDVETILRDSFARG